MAFDTSTDVVSVALHDGSGVVAHRVGRGARRHAEMLSPLVGEVLAEAGVGGPDLDGIGVGVGPGAYTGLRVGLVTAQALGLAWAVDVSGACSLDAIAVQAVAEQPGRLPDGLLVVSDARRRQVFWARYTGQGLRVAGPTVSSPDAVPDRHLPAFGAGALAHPGVFATADEPALPDAGWLAQGLVDGRISPLPVVPLYLRQPDVTPAGAKSVLQRTTTR